ncbi:hypothetical protein BC826DRAFT_1043553 [Russula brevipes]|nr:hypothetical protein BC826DRAFT_1043553 [Russula brevipes]
MHAPKTGSMGPLPRPSERLSDGLAAYAIPPYNTLAVQKHPTGSTELVRAPGPLDPSTLPEIEPARARLCARC